MSKESNIREVRKLIVNNPRPERISSGNTLKHELVKQIAVYHLKKSGKTVYTEVELVGGGRCDILVPEDKVYIEVLLSESVSKLRDKVKKYPKELRMIEIECDKVWPDGATFEEVSREIREYVV